MNFEEWYNKEYPLPATIERGPIGREQKSACKKAYQAGYEALKASHDKKEEALERIQNWAKAYPLKSFPKPTEDNWKQAEEVLKANGLSITRLSADNMRHVLDGIKDIVDEALREAGEI